MRKLYAFIVCMAVVLGLSASTLQAQSYNAQSYLVRTEADPWINISGTPMPEIFSSYNTYGDCNVSDPISIPFNFRLADRVSHTFRVTPAGTVFFDTASYANVYRNAQLGYWFNVDYGYYGFWYAYDYSNSYQQLSYTPIYSIMPWAGQHYNGPITTWQWAVVGTAPNRKFVVETDNAQGYYQQAYSGGGTQGSYQVILSESGISTIEFAYHASSYSSTYAWQASGAGVVTGIKVGGYYVYNYPPGSYNYAPSNNQYVSISTSPAYNTPGLSPAKVSSYSSYYNNQYNNLPTVGYRVFIAFPYDLSADAITYPANQSILVANQTLSPTGVISNQGSQPLTGATVRRQIWRLGDATPLYTSDIVLSSTPDIYGNSLPANFTSKTVTFAPFTIPAAPGGYGIYEDTMYVVSTVPTESSGASINNVTVSEFTVSPPNNIKAITVTNPAPNTRTPINISTPIGVRFKNIGGNNQINVPVTAIIKNPAGQVVYRDTAILKNFPSGVIYDTLFREYTFPTNGDYTVCGIAIMTTDDLKLDDTTCTTVKVRYEADVAAVSVFNPQADEEKPYTKVFKPIGTFQSVGVSDLFDVPARVQIRRCSDGALAFQADSTIPELNTDKGPIQFGFPTKQGNYDITKLTPGCYTQCVIARYPTDGDHTNDTACTTFSVIDRLKGNIEVGVGRRFQTLTAALDSMKFRGIGGPLNLILTDASYSENGATDASSPIAALDFRDILGSTDTAIVTFKPKVGVSPVITFTGNRPFNFYFGYHSPSWFVFNGNNQIVPTPDLVTAEPIKRGITVINNSTASGAVFGLEYGPNHLTLRNMKLVGNGQFTNDSSSVVRLYNETSQQSFLNFFRRQDTTKAHDILIDNNEIGNAKYGVWELGLRPAYNLGMGVFVNLRDYNNTFSRNTIGTAARQIGFAGVAFDHTDNLTISHNEISWVNAVLSGASFAIGIEEMGSGNVTGTLVDANKIHNITSTSQADGIGFDQASVIYTNGTGVNQASSVLPVITNNRVTNNAIYDLRTDNTIGSSYPLYFETNSQNYFTDRDSVFNNSFSTKFATVNIYLSGQRHVFSWNNIIQNTNTANNAFTNYFMSVPRPMQTAISSDYNLFDLTGANRTFAQVSEYNLSAAPVTGTYIQLRTFRRLNDWQSFLGQDIHSVTGNPLFTTDSLHLPNALSSSVSPASNAGAWLNTATQYYDIDGDSRQIGSNTPDIGADEFEGLQYPNDVAVLTILHPAGYSATSDTSFVTTENPLPIDALVKNVGGQISPNRVVTAKLEVAISGGAFQQIYTQSQTLTFNVNETKDVFFTGPRLTNPQAQNGVFRLTVSVDNDQNNSNNVQTKTFRVLLKNNALLVAYESLDAKGLQNRDSVTAALRRLGVPYDSLDRSAYSSIDVDYTPWWTLVWVSGDPNTATSGTTSVGGVSFKATEEIERYLNAGRSYARKSLVIAGQNIALYNDASNIAGNGITDTLFMHQYLHTRYVGNTPAIGGYTGMLTGQQVYFTSQDYISATSPDVVQRAQITGPVGNDVTGIAYTYGTHPLTPSDSAAGTTWHGTTNNVVFFAFDWADAQQTFPSQAGIITSGATRIMRGALDFISAFRGTVLPVEFVTVNATKEATSNLITWTVANQKDIAHYDVESLVGSTWSPVGQVKAADGTTYSFNDANVASAKTYSYRIVSIDLNGARTTSTSVNVSRNLPVDFTLGQNYPNPFNPTSTISYSLPSNAVVTMKVVDLTGKIVRTEISAEAQTAGDHSYIFNANELASGTYVYQLTATSPNGQTVTLTKKMTLTK
jgi:hypothetical protein